MAGGGISREEKEFNTLSPFTVMYLRLQTYPEFNTLFGLYLDCLALFLDCICYLHHFSNWDQMNLYQIMYIGMNPGWVHTAFLQLYTLRFLQFLILSIHGS